MYYKKYYLLKLLTLSSWYGKRNLPLCLGFFFFWYFLITLNVEKNVMLLLLYHFYVNVCALNKHNFILINQPDCSAKIHQKTNVLSIATVVVRTPKIVTKPNRHAPENTEKKLHVLKKKNRNYKHSAFIETLCPILLFYDFLSLPLSILYNASPLYWSINVANLKKI